MELLALLKIYGIMVGLIFLISISLIKKSDLERMHVEQSIPVHLNLVVRAVFYINALVVSLFWVYYLPKYTVKKIKLIRKGYNDVPFPK